MAIIVTTKANPPQTRPMIPVDNPAKTPKIKFLFSVSDFQPKTKKYKAAKKKTIPKASLSPTPDIVLNKYGGIIVNNKLESKATL